MANDKDFKIKNGLQLGGAFIEKVGTIAGNATLDLSTGNVFDCTPTADATFVFSNAGETEHSFVLSVTGVDIGVSYDLANASYDGVSFANAQDSAPRGLVFKPDGTKIYIVGWISDSVNEYNLSIAWDVSTASYLQAFSIAAQDSFPQGLFFKPDGTKMYMLGAQGDDVNEYSLSAAWDVSSASYVQNFSLASQSGSKVDLFISSDGLNLYTFNGNFKTVLQYSMSSAWDISTISYVRNLFVGGQETQVQGIFFKPDGLKMYLSGAQGDDVNEYDLSTAWNISTASYLQNFSVSTEAASPDGVLFKPDGTKMYILDGSGGVAYQYTTGASDIAIFTYPASVYWPSGTVPVAPAVGETDILEFSTTDGGTVWYGTRAGDAMA